MPKRKRKRTSRRTRRARRRAPLLRRGSLLLVLATALVIAGFITRRVLVPRAVHFMQHRPASRPEMPVANAAPVEPGPAPHPGKQDGVAQAVPDDGAHGEHTTRTDTITEHDRRALDRILRDRSK